MNKILNTCQYFFAELSVTMTVKKTLLAPEILQD